MINYVEYELMNSKKKTLKTKKIESNTEWLDKIINQLTNKELYN